MKRRQTAAAVMGIIGALCILYSVISSVFLLLFPDGGLYRIAFDINVMIVTASAGIAAFVGFMVLNSRPKRD